MTDLPPLFPDGVDQLVHAIPDPLDTFLAFLGEMQLDAAARETAYEAWLNEAAPQIATELTEELIPAELRAAGVRFAWVEAR